VLHREGCGQALAYVYFEEEPGRRAAANLLTNDEARRIRGQHRQAAGPAAAESPWWLMRSVNEFTASCG
jgi:hypothetical protein